MKNISFSNLALLLLPMLASAQSARRPIVDITTSPRGWSNNQANLCAQVMTIPRIGLCASFDFQATEGVQGNFLTQFSQWGIHAEIRVFPFGEARRYNIIQKKADKQKRFQEKSICYTFAAQTNRFEEGVKKLLSGLYIAPGFVYRQEQLGFAPVSGTESPIADFRYDIKSKGGSFALGYQIRFGHLTLGAGWAIQATQPRWSGPVDIFGDDLYTTTNPWKLNVQHGLRLEVGINF